MAERQAPAGIHRAFKKTLMKAEDLKALQAPLKSAYRENPQSAVITLDAEGVLGEENISCKSEEQLENLLKLTERYCVVYQSLKNSPDLTLAPLRKAG